MARRYYSSTAARTTLATGVDDTTTTLSVTAVSGWPSSFPYTLIIDADTVNEEIVEVSARSGTTLTVTRGVDGTSAVAHSSGAAVQHGVSARDFDEPNAFINGTGTVTETLLASNAVTSAKILDGTIVNADINASAAIAQSKIANLTSDLASKVDYALPVNTQTGTTYTFVLADAEKLTTASNAAAVTLTIPPQSSVTWADNTILRVVNYGAGAVTVNGGSGVTVTNTATTIEQFQSAAAIRTGSDAWTLVPFGGGGPSIPSSVDYLVIAGGGGGGASIGGGGGAGGYLSGSVAPTGVSHTITVGGGGSGGSGTFGANGASSSFGSLISTSGGGGGGGPFNNNNAKSGGSGGGGAARTGGSSGGGSTSGQGNNGGTGTESGGNWAAGGGGGKNGAGGNGVAGSTGGSGGSGLASSITGTSVTRGGGGGGAGLNSSQGSGGSGGGGSAGSGGAANTGGGGGGGLFTFNGASGGSGIVIISQTRSDSDVIAQTTGSPEFILTSTKIIYVFKSSGSIQWVA